MKDQVLKYSSDKQNEVVFCESDNNLKENPPDNNVMENLLIFKMNNRIDT